MIDPDQNNLITFLVRLNCWFDNGARNLIIANCRSAGLWFVFLGMKQKFAIVILFILLRLVQRWMILIDGYCPQFFPIFLRLLFAQAKEILIFCNRIIKYFAIKYVRLVFHSSVMPLQQIALRNKQSNHQKYSCQKTYQFYLSVKLLMKYNKDQKISSSLSSQVYLLQYSEEKDRQAMLGYCRRLQLRDQDAPKAQQISQINISHQSISNYHYLIRSKAIRNHTNFILIIRLLLVRSQNRNSVDCLGIFELYAITQDNHFRMISGQMGYSGQYQGLSDGELVEGSESIVFVEYYKLDVLLLADVEHLIEGIGYVGRFKQMAFKYEIKRNSHHKLIYSNIIIGCHFVPFPISLNCYSTIILCSLLRSVASLSMISQRLRHFIQAISSFSTCICSFMSYKFSLSIMKFFSSIQFYSLWMIRDSSFMVA